MRTSPSHIVLVLSLVAAGCSSPRTSTDADAALDAAADVPAARDTSDTVDVADAADASDPIDAADADDASDTIDAANADDASDTIDASDAIDVAVAMDALPVCVVVSCAGHVYACGDCVDNDGDSLVDSQDPDCLGPCDNTEASFYGGIPGGSGPACIEDCYWDNDTGSGNDDCYWNHRCDPHEVSPNYYPESWNGSVCAYNPATLTSGTTRTCAQLAATQSSTCTSVCGSLTPRGCDAFGCCELPAGSGDHVFVGTQDGAGNGTCDLAHQSDPSRCAPCTPTPSTLVPCGHCDLCIGKTVLPTDCYSTPGGDASVAASRCGPTGVPCGLAGEPSCAAGQYCITGCCQTTAL